MRRRDFESTMAEARPRSFRPQRGQACSGAVPAVALAVAAGLSACAPEFNWREVRTADGSASAMFPCRPDRRERDVPLAGRVRHMHLIVCAVGESTFALGTLDVLDAGEVAAGLSALRASTLNNVGGRNFDVVPWSLPGMSAHAESVRLAADGQLVNGAPIRLHTAFFAQGVHLYQASVVSPKVAPEAVENFFAGLKLVAGGPAK